MTLSLTPTAPETTGDLRDALKPFAKLADIYDVWDDPGSDELRLTTEHVSEESPDESFTIGDLRRARTALATPTTPHPTGDVAALRALKNAIDPAHMRGWSAGRAAENQFRSACEIYVRDQLAGADTTAAPGSDGGGEDELWEALGKILALFTDDGYIDCSLTQQIGVYKEARAALARRSTPATGGAARLDRGAVARIIRKHIRLDRFPYADSSLNYESVDAAATAVLAALDPDPQPQAASEGDAEERITRLEAALASARRQIGEQSQRADAADAARVALESDKVHPFSVDVQEHRNEAYKGGWDDGYAEGFGKAKADALAAITPAERGADAGGWRPIETAPKDGTHVLVAQFGAKPIRAWYQNDRWWMHGCGPYDHRPADLTGDHAPTHWMPLPAAPTAPGEA